MSYAGFRGIVILGAAILFAGTPVYGSATTYSNQTSWLAAVTNPVTINFSGVAPSGGSANFSTSTGYSANGAEFLGLTSTGSYSLAVVDQNYQAPYYNWGFSAELQGPNNYFLTTPSTLPYIDVVLPAQTTSLAVNLMVYGDGGAPVLVTLSDGETFTVTTHTFPTPAFFGVTTTVPITYASFTVENVPLGQTGTYGLLGNFQYATSSDTPEIASLMMIGAGLSALGVYRKRLRPGQPATA